MGRVNANHGLSVNIEKLPRRVRSRATCPPAEGKPRLDCPTVVSRQAPHRFHPRVLDSGTMALDPQAKGRPRCRGRCA